VRAPAEILASIGRPKVVVVGDLILDQYVTGAVDRISPEAPVQVLRVESDDTRLGGAGSVAHDLAVLGADVTLVGVLGSDDAGKRFVDRAQTAGVRPQALTDPTRPTSVKTRHLARSQRWAADASNPLPQQVLRVDRESTEPLAAGLEAALVQTLSAELARADAVVVSDYAKGLLTEGVLAAVFRWAKESGRPAIVDPKREDFSVYRGATGITPNRPETGVATGVRVKTLADAEKAAESLVSRFGFGFVLVTLDREGMLLKDGSSAARHFPSTPREVFDVTGAGDMVVAVMGLVLASGGTPAEAASLANVAAGIEVERVGAVPISRAEIAERLSGAATSGGRGPKAVDRAAAAALARALRAGGKRIAFTNGCFDVLHAGHARLLAFARAQADVLFVGLNSDDGVRRLKGESRPVNAQDDRVEMLCALGAVDHVVVFPEDDPVALIRAIEPDVLVKGADWKDRGVLGREIVEARGGKVVLAPLLEGRSSTATIERLRPKEASRP
jgi:D-beta-D-heptose 7-phosphate kinase / D-beta-D-heptose 1-phosphate adenosyltransferase